MNNIKLRELVREEVTKVLRSKKTINEGILGKLLNAFWTITGTKGALFKAIQSKYGADAKKYKSELDDITHRLEKIHTDLQDALDMPENKRY